MRLVLTALLWLTFCSSVQARVYPTDHLTHSEHVLSPLESLIYRKCKIEFSKAKAIEKAKFYAPIIRRVAGHYKLPPRIIAALIWHESNYKPRETSSCGALGLMQVIPFEGRFKRGQNPFDPATNMSVGCGILKGYLLRCHGDWSRALTAYNYGMLPVSRGLSRTPYSRAVLLSAGTL